MKNLPNLKLLSIAIALYLTLGTTNLFAQVCLPSISETSGGGPSGVGNTGNDIWEDADGSLRVVVFDGATPGIAWSYDGTLISGVVASSTFQPTDVIDPDVVITRVNGGDEYVIVVYYSPSNQKYYQDNWKLDPTTGMLTDLGNNGFQVSPLYGTSLNVDANEVGDYVIVWDENYTSSDNIFTCAGATGSFTPPALCSPVVTMPNTKGYHMPDVALNEFPWQQGYAHIHYTYLNANYKKIYEAEDKVWYICNNLPNNFVQWGMGVPNSNDAYYTPRIACPDENGTDEDWSIVWNFIDNANGFYEILGHTRYSYSDYSHVYTDGSEIGIPWPDTQGPFHKRPCISYDNNNDGIQLAWLSVWQSVTSSLGGSTVIGLTCDVKGSVISSCYQKAPLSVSADAQDIPSLSGRHAYNPNMLVAFVDYSAPDVLYKIFTWNSGFRLADVEENPSISIYPNPFSDELKFTVSGSSVDHFTVQIQDMTGKILLSAEGSESVLNNELTKIANQLSSGVYLLNIQSENGDVSANKKLIKM